MSTSGQTAGESNNFMALEPRLVELVRQAVKGMSPAVHVLTTAELADVKESAQRTPDSIGLATRSSKPPRARGARSSCARRNLLRMSSCTSHMTLPGALRSCFSSRGKS